MTDPATPPVHPRRRFPARLYDSGSEPDPRFTLANERTFLAWLRTSLALIAAGVALEVLAAGIQPGLRLAAALLLAVSGLVAPFQAWFGWYLAERAMRLQRPLPSPVLALPLTAAVVAAGVLIVIGLLV